MTLVSPAARRVLIEPAEFGLNPASFSYATAAASLLTQQKSMWPLLRAGYASLGSVQTREFFFDGSTVKVQFNPGRITSSSANVDEKSIKERKCFLCLAHLPEEQRGVAFGDSYVVLCNPFPIFPEHFTIPHCTHIPQRIGSSFGILLDLAKSLGDRYTVFYNGPRCGASAPDHLHFQAGLKRFMPLDTEYVQLVQSHGSVIRQADGCRTIAVDGGLRRFLALESSSRDALEREFADVLPRLQAVAGEKDEPMLNILALYENGWRVLVFPRARHRPSFFFAEGDEKILISPAAVDLGGVCITPLEKDFHKVTREHIAQMFEEITLGRTEFGELTRALA
jgi:hypothetical protein